MERLWFVIFLLLASPTLAESTSTSSQNHKAKKSAYYDLGVSRGDVNGLLTSEGLSPLFTKFPPFEGEPVTSATVIKPHLRVDMIGPDEGLTEISLTFGVSDNHLEVYWQEFISFWLLASVFPDWENREEWLTRAILSGERVEFRRNRYDVGMDRSANGRLLFIVISGQKIE